MDRQSPKRSKSFNASAILFCFGFLTYMAGSVLAFSATVNQSPPSATMRLVFVHHSTGQNWLNNVLRSALNSNNYYVTETDYGWGPSEPTLGGTIGDHTDIGHWYNWFLGPNRNTYLAALFSNSNQEAPNIGVSDPGGSNKVVMFKSCFPNSALKGNPNDAPTTGSNPLRGNDADSAYHTVANAKGIYVDLLSYFATKQDTLFVAITAPPLVASATNSVQAANARAFNEWLTKDWLASYPYHNVAVYDFYDVLTSNGGNSNTNDLGSASGNHHRIRNGKIEHISNQGSNYSMYGSGDSHPTAAGNQKAAGEFVPFLNVIFHCWQGNGPCSSNNPSSVDFDGDARSDITVWRPGGGEWFVLPSGSSGSYTHTSWGLPDDIPVSGDYDGDGRTDAAVWRPATGVWYILPSKSPSTYLSTQWGSSTDTAVPGDYDGDGKMDIAVWRSGVWYVLPSASANSYATTQWGVDGDVPVPGDYDGDGKTDIAVWRPSSGTWYVLPSASPGNYTAAQWGISTDFPVAGDYDGDGKTEMAVWRSSSGIWYILPSASSSNYTAVQWGISTDVPVPGDYDGDGKADMAVWRSGTGMWYALRSGTAGSYTATQWGLPTDKPILYNALHQ
jgi:hypothetical protein